MNEVQRVVVLVDEGTPEAELHDLLDGYAGRPVTVLASSGRYPRPPADRPRHVLIVARAPGGEVERLAQYGPIDAVIDVRGVRRETRRDRWRRLFLLVRKGGCWIVRARVGEDLRESERSWLDEIAGRAVGSPDADPIVAECVRAVGDVTGSAEEIIMLKAEHHLAKLRKGEVGTLERRDPDVGVRTILTLPALTFCADSEIVSHTSSLTHLGLQATQRVPEMTVNHYTGPLVFGGGMLVTTPNSILNESFRFFRAAQFSNPSTLNLGGRAARVIPTIADPDRCLTGHYYLVDPQFSGHFGHIMTELVGRLWGWDAAKRDCPDLKVLLRRWPDSDAVVERTLLNAYGIDDEDVVIVDEPAHIRSLYAATIMWHNWPPHFTHPRVADVWRRIASRLVTPDAPRHEKIFVSRPAGNDVRRCRNAAEVEHFFAARGFKIVYPELYGLAEQAAIFAGATTVAGFAGSGMFGLMYSSRAQNVIILAHEAYTARNELMYGLVQGCDVHYFWSTGDVAQPAGSWNMQAFMSEWSFDFERNADELDGVLATTGSRHSVRA